MGLRWSYVGCHFYNLFFYLIPFIFRRISPNKFYCNQIYTQLGTVPKTLYLEFFIFCITCPFYILSYSIGQEKSLQDFPRHSCYQILNFPTFLMTNQFAFDYQITTITQLALDKQLPLSNLIFHIHYGYQNL